MRGGHAQFAGAATLLRLEVELCDREADRNLLPFLWRASRCRARMVGVGVNGPLLQFEHQGTVRLPRDAAAFLPLSKQPYAIRRYSELLSAVRNAILNGGAVLRILRRVVRP